MNWFVVVEYIVTFLLGCGLGATELLSRYRDAPLTIMAARSSYFYAGLNGFIAIVSLALLQTIATDLVPDDDKYRWIYEVLIAGFGGAALFRSAIVRARVADTDIGIGPSFVVETLLALTDRDVDRWRASRRAAEVAPLVADLPVGFVSEALTPYCLNLMQNLSAQERQDVETKMDAVLTKKIDKDVKPLIFGLMLVNIVGLEALSEAKRSLKWLIEKKKQVSAGTLPSEEALQETIKRQAAEGAPPDNTS